MRIIGAGFGRTGTMSLKQALEQLGYRCYHMEEVLANIRRGDLDLWSHVLEGRPPDWQRIFEGYEATVDFPACIYYRQLMKAFPDAVVILTVRDPERWWRSYSALMRVYRCMHLLAPIPAVGRLIRFGERFLNVAFDGHTDKETCVGRFQQHIEDVRAHVPPGRLLVYSVKEGWGPICRFLGEPVPDRPFPHANVGMSKAWRVLLKVAIPGR